VELCGTSHSKEIYVRFQLLQGNAVVSITYSREMRAASYSIRMLRFQLRYADVWYLLQKEYVVVLVTPWWYVVLVIPREL
jgi:hypothetical protein